MSERFEPMLLLALLREVQMPPHVEAFATRFIAQVEERERELRERVAKLERQLAESREFAGAMHSAAIRAEDECARRSGGGNG